MTARQQTLMHLAVSAWVLLAAPTLAIAGQKDSKKATFSRDIAPILQRSCQNCHRPNGGIAPMALTTYDEVRPWARAIKLKTSKREMPPWYIEKNVGIQQFKNDISLTDEEIATIGAWVDAGAPQGNPADMPPPLHFADSNAWAFGEPDLVVRSPVVTVKAVAGDYHAPSLGKAPTGLTEDRWVAALEVKEVRLGEKRTTGSGSGGNNYFAVHHSAISTNAPGEEDTGEGGAADDGAAPRGGLQYVYEVGQNAQIVPADVGVLLKAGQEIYFNSYHLHSIGKEVQIQIQIAFKFHPRGYTPKYPQGFRSGANTPRNSGGGELDIPGNTDNVRFDRFFTLNQPARLATFEPHLHASGKRMCVEAIHPTGIIETLNCAGYNHSWVKSYAYQEDAAPLLPKGTILHVIAWYDNTSNNPRVVDPRNWKGFGQRSIDDMLIFFGKFVYFTDQEFNAEVAARAAKPRPASVGQQQ